MILSDFSNFKIKNRLDLLQKVESAMHRSYHKLHNHIDNVVKPTYKKIKNLKKPIIMMDPKCQSAERKHYISYVVNVNYYDGPHYNHNKGPHYEMSTAWYGPIPPRFFSNQEFGQVVYNIRKYNDTLCKRFWRLHDVFLKLAASYLNKNIKYHIGIVYQLTLNDRVYYFAFLESSHNSGYGWRWINEGNTEIQKVN